MTKYRSIMDRLRDLEDRLDDVIPGMDFAIRIMKLERDLGRQPEYHDLSPVDRAQLRVFCEGDLPDPEEHGGIVRALAKLCRPIWESRGARR